MMASNLPGYNCGQCGFNTCEQYKHSHSIGRGSKKKCPFQSITKSEGKNSFSSTEIKGVIDNQAADFTLAPLQGEPSCRERLLPITPNKLTSNSYIRYRPIGCPIVHYAHVLNNYQGLITVHVVGPKAHNFYTDIGLCMVIGFEGEVKEGKIPNMCDTVRFMPHKCMMRKVHSGVVTEVVGNHIKIELIDLKVWQR